MKPLTKERIEKIANEIMTYCDKHNYGDVTLYFNDKSMSNSRKTTDNVDPHRYLKYCPYEHIISMTNEGSMLEEDILGEKGVFKIFRKYGLYAEMGSCWYCSCYPLKDSMEIEYTYYDKPKERIIFYANSVQNDMRLIKLVRVYNKALEEAESKTNGSCVIGDGINFTLNDQPYKFITTYNQSDVVKSVIDACQEYLEYIGATQIQYDCGRLD